MTSVYEISDDDDSFCELGTVPQKELSSGETTVILSDEECAEITMITEEDISSDDDELPNVDLGKKRSEVIKKLFPTKNTNQSKQNMFSSMQKVIPKPKPLNSEDFNSKTASSTSMISPVKPKEPGFEKMIGGVTVNLPVEPYGCQIALMSKVITAIKKKQNCLLESPTGTGKTLALLCSALAWQHAERCRKGTMQAQEYFSHYPELSEVDRATQLIGSPEKLPFDNFTRSVFGEKSIYDEPNTHATDRIILKQNQHFGKGDENTYWNGTVVCSGGKRQEPLQELNESPDNLVKIHPKRQKLNPYETGEGPSTPLKPKFTPPSTPTKPINQPAPETPEQIKKLYSLMSSLRLRTGTLVDCSIPTIYYGARTHKQLQQVIKEFKRTSYCGEVKMSVLSSREYSCIRDYDRAQWTSKNDMCRECIKPKSSKTLESNCSFYDNRAALRHDSLPPAFDLEELVSAGRERRACAHYAARALASAAQLVFCPYNYLIEPSIRSSMQIDLEDNIVIVDEAHNIEDICRDAASLSFTRDHILNALKELGPVSESRYQNGDSQIYVIKIIQTLNNWDYWFANQSKLLAGKAVTNNEVDHVWEPEHFVQTLNNHNIGPKQYNEFKESAELLCRKLREEPRALRVRQASAALLDEIKTVLGYLFLFDGKFMNDFTPALVKTVTWEAEHQTGLWRRTSQRVEKETLELRLMCMNPAIVFAGLKAARCVLLASGTLTPLHSLYSELDTEFPLKVSPNHVIPKERVWVGTLTTGPDGQPLQCKSNDTSQVAVQDSLGKTITWVCRVTPNGVLCFLPSYRLMDQLEKRWRENGMWNELNQLKHVFVESRNVKDHNETMEDYYKYVDTNKGAILFAVFRGKVSEGMDFKDQQARAVVTIGIPYPNMFDRAVQAKVKYNDKYSRTRNLLPRGEWLLVQAYRALNQAVGRCVRHRADWGAVLLVDARFLQTNYTQHLSGWLKALLGKNHFTFDRLVNSADSLESFMQTMSLEEIEDVS
ncbi:Fanconi anemia group J protein homolog isoform X2 [Plodia interpunctella]|uniref:Fanconi anemia group J protein homolog isoform X2 n=1 Tax=Plodia interpunctella TaxID=58824 RepID=UPI0023687738|nr:Fanconi anemia group J protein homolog isoform X2 [Plodia interpunctella]